MISSVSDLRTWILLALWVSLPLNAVAGVTYVAGCPAQMSASHQVGAAGDCCPGKGHPSAPCKEHGGGSAPMKNGSAPGKSDPCGGACKAGLHSPQAWEPSLPTSVPAQPARPLLSTDPPTLLLAHGPGGLWRPPCLS